MSFEQELVKAIEHGCPGELNDGTTCGKDDFSMDGLQWVSYAPSIITANATKGIHWDQIQQSYEHYKDISLCCSDCGLELWSEQGGWIPELAEIVKGE